MRGLLIENGLMIVKRRHLRYAIPELPKLFIIENLCPRYRSIFDACSDLKKNGRIRYLWSFNGIVHFKVTDNFNERGKKVFHLNDLDEHFSND